MLIHPGNASPEFAAHMARYPGLRLARPDDSQRLSDFFNTTAMSAGQLSIGFVRGSDFFALLALQAERYAALVCEENGMIVGVGALSMRHAFVRGKLTPVGYLQDLRLSPQSKTKTRQSLYACFTEFVRLSPQWDDFNRCSLFLTAILDENTPARAALSRASFPLEYSRLASYKAHLWPKLPGLEKLLPVKTNVETGHEEKLLHFYKETLGTLAFDLTLDDVSRLLPRAVPVTIEKEGQGIAAACLLVNTDEERRLRVRYNPVGRSLETSGTYLTAVRVGRSVAAELKDGVMKDLLAKALKTSLRMKGSFTGIIEMQDGPVPFPFLAAQSHYTVSGSLYRVFHPEHTQLADFSAGFLRPAHKASFEWIFS
ncbi:MAG: hypothetical protein RIR26_756 [Pseudomonadota bacterium]